MECPPGDAHWASLHRVATKALHASVVGSLPVCEGVLAVRDCQEQDRNYASGVVVPGRFKSPASSSSVAIKSRSERIGASAKNNLP